MRFTCVLTLLLILNANALALVDSTQAGASLISTPRLRSVQADFTTVFLINAASLSVDIDLKQLRMSKNQNCFGLRAGIECIQAFGFDGEVYGSPFVDYNVLARLTTAGITSRFDVYAGYAHRRRLGEDPFQQLYPPIGLFKIGFEGKWMIVENTFGLMLKLSVVRGGKDQTGSGGIGISLGWDH